MSAIAGILNLDGKPSSPDLLRSMTDTARHRGPDGEGVWSDGPVGIGAQMHWTTPEARFERQPTVSADGALAIVWDGRLDNREELVGTLSRRSGVDARSTDVDLVLAAYRRWGVDCPRQLVGDYAFAIWDRRQRQLLCARDPIGVRLFHYHFDGKRLLFGTEIKQIFADPSVPRDLDELMLGLYLCGNTRYGDRTFYNSVKRLPGGHVLVASRDGLETRPFWNPDPADEIRYPRERVYQEHFRELLTSAVRSRLRSVTPVAIQLSGGLDSGAITAITGKEERGRDRSVRAYHLAYADNPAPEWRLAEIVASSAGIPLASISVDDTWAMKPTPGIRDLDEPFLLHFEAMQHRALERARFDGCAVELTGEGGDEAFSAGYTLYMRDWLAGGRWLRLFRDYRNGTPGYRRRAQGMLKRAIAPRIRQRLRREPHPAIPTWLNEGFVKRTHLSRELDAREAYCYRDSDYTQSRGFPTFFAGMDRRGAAFGVELRHPFWDSRLVDFMVRIPPEVRVQAGRPKLLLKKALRDLLPPELLGHRPQGAFGPLYTRGFKDRETEHLETLLLCSRLAGMGVIDPAAALNAYRSYREGDDSRFRGLFWAFVTEEWLQAEPVCLLPRGTSQPATRLAPGSHSADLVPGSRDLAPSQTGSGRSER